MRKTTLASGVLLAVMLVALLLIGMVGSAPEAAAQSAAAPVLRTYTLYGPTAVTTSTVNTAAPNVDAFGRDMAKPEGFSTADVFVTVDGTDTFSAIAKVQFSADGVNWADYQYEYESQTSEWESEGITSTATASTAIAWHAPSVTLTADGSKLMQVPLAGEWMRVQIAVTGAVTPTVLVTYRN